MGCVRIEGGHSRSGGVRVRLRLVERLHGLCRERHVLFPSHTLFPLTLSSFLLHASRQIGMMGLLFRDDGRLFYYLLPALSLKRRARVCGELDTPSHDTRLDERDGVAVSRLCARMVELVVSCVWRDGAPRCRV